MTPPKKKPAQRKHIKKCNEFPKINKKNHSIKSPQTSQYNCIAFAAGETTRKWWPQFSPDAFWPSGAPYSDSPQSFEKAFETLGYKKCSDGKFEDGVEKLAFYTDNGRVKHAAKQVRKGMWASKLGGFEDIHHERDAIAGGLYGQPTFYMSKQKR